MTSWMTSLASSRPSSDSADSETPMRSSLLSLAMLRRHLHVHAGVGVDDLHVGRQQRGTSNRLALVGRVRRQEASTYVDYVRLELGWGWSLDAEVLALGEREGVAGRVTISSDC